MKYGLIKGVFAVAALVSLTATAARADILNGGFELGLAGWDGIGTVGTSTFFLGADGLHFADQGFRMATLRAAGAERAQIEQFLGLGNGQLNTLGTQAIRDGSALRQTFMANAGDSVSFSWNFVGNDYMPHNDFGFVSLVPSTPSAQVLGSIQTSGNFGSTGWQTFTHTFTAGGNYTLGFGVVNALDQQFDSFLLLDRVQFNSTTPSAVPEPGAVATAIVFGGALLGGIIVGKRRRSKAGEVSPVLGSADDSVLAAAS